MIDIIVIFQKGVELGERLFKVKFLKCCNNYVVSDMAYDFHEDFVASCLNQDIYPSAIILLISSYGVIKPKHVLILTDDLTCMYLSTADRTKKLDSTIKIYNNKIIAFRHSTTQQIIYTANEFHMRKKCTE